MRIALLSPYSWTYPGGVTRHIEALAEHLLEQGHHVRVLAPYDPPGRYSAALHRGARPQELGAPDYLVPLGRTIGFKANGAVSNLSLTPYGLSTAQKELRTGRYDVVHVHEPIAPIPPWVITDSMRMPLVATFHTYNENKLSNGIANLLGARQMFNRLHVRVAVSEAAAWTARRFFGGHYRIIPNGVEVDPEQARRAAERPTGEALRIVFVGQAVERKGLPLLLGAFEALREHIPTELTLIGPTADELSPFLLDIAERSRARKGRPRDQGPGARAGRPAGRPVAARRELRDGPRPRRSPPEPRSSPRTSPAIATWSATASTVCWSRPAMPRRSPRCSGICTRHRSGAPSWRAGRPGTWSGSRGLE